MIRSTNSSRSRRWLAVAICSAAVPLAVGCASGGSGGAQAGGDAPPAARQAASSKPITGKLAQVKMGMSDSDVRSLLGEPSRSGSYPTWKNWVPFAGLGGDTMRTDYVYEGQGKVVFSRNAYTQRLKVVAVVPE